MSTRAEFEIVSGTRRTESRRRESRPLRLLVVSDLGGSSPERLDSFGTKRLTVDNFDDVMATVRPTVTLGEEAVAVGGEAAVTQRGEAAVTRRGEAGPAAAVLEISSVDALHPDRLVAEVPALRALLDLRERLLHPATEQAALAELSRLTRRESKAATESTSEPALEPSASDGVEHESQLFARLLGTAGGSNVTKAKSGTGGSTAGSTAGNPAVRRLIEDAFAESGRSEGSSVSARQGEQLVAERLGDGLRALLCTPRFRDVERAWRSLHWLVSRLEDDQAEVHVLDLAQDAARRHLAEHASRLDASPLHNLLCDGEDGWDLIVADYTFDLCVEDMTLLATIGALAMRAGAPCIAHGSLTLVGCETDAAVESPWEWSLPQDELGTFWAELRRHPAARWVGLAAPRFLLRHPYGKRSDPIERFEFEELPSRPARERFLWGNPAFACALIMARAHESGGARWPAADAAVVEDLPAPVFDDGSGDAVQPPVEFLLSERARAAAMHGGLIVAASGRNINYASFGGLFPVAAG